jgi:hypothetical protein
VCLSHTLALVFDPAHVLAFVSLNRSFADVQSSFDSGSPNDATQAQLQSAVDRNPSLLQLHLRIGRFEIKFEQRPGLLTKGARSYS